MKKFIFLLFAIVSFFGGLAFAGRSAAGGGDLVVVGQEDTGQAENYVPESQYTAPVYFNELLNPQNQSNLSVYNQEVESAGSDSDSDVYQDALEKIFPQDKQTILTPFPGPSNDSTQKKIGQAEILKQYIKQISQLKSGPLNDTDLPQSVQDALKLGP